MNKISERHVSEPSTAFSSDTSHTWLCSSSESEENPQGSTCSRTVSEPCLASPRRLRTPVPTFPNIPWTRSRQYEPTLEGLQWEIVECFNWLRPTEQERLARVTVCQRVREILCQFWNNAKCYVYGSVANNLFLPSSDIDISVDGPRISHQEMQIAALAFEQSSHFIKVQVLDRINVPIIKLTDRDSGINVDVSFNTNHATFTVEYIYSMRQLLPVLEPLTLILKQFLASRKLNQAFTGGLSSYGLVLMIIHFLLTNYRECFMWKPLDQLGPGILAEFFLDFLHFYGSQFDAMTDGLAFPSYYIAKRVSKAELVALCREDLYTSSFCIQDPLDSKNDVGRSAHNFPYIRAAFMSAWTDLNAVIQGEKCQHNGQPLLQSILTFDADFVELRDRLNALPFLNIRKHRGNEPHLFGGHRTTYHPLPPPPHAAILLPPPPMYLPSNRARLPLGSTDDAAEGSSRSSVSDAASSPQPPMISYYQVPPHMAQMYNVLPPGAVTSGANFVPVVYPSPYIPPHSTYLCMMNGYFSSTNSNLNGYCTDDAFIAPDACSQKSQRGDSESSAVSTTSSSSITSCTTVTPDCDDSSVTGSDQASSGLSD